MTSDAVHLTPGAGNQIEAQLPRPRPDEPLECHACPPDGTPHVNDWLCPCRPSVRAEVDAAGRTWRVVVHRDAQGRLAESAMP